MDIDLTSNFLVSLGLPWGVLGSLLVASWPVFGVSGAPFALAWSPFGLALDSLGLPEVSLDLFSVSLGFSWSLLGSLGTPFV